MKTRELAHFRDELLKGKEIAAEYHMTVARNADPVDSL
jgi:hypothetical protein